MTRRTGLPRRLGKRQRGISLLIVMVVVLLSSLLALWTFRSALVNEAIVGNDADHLRAFEAAQAMVQDAELDIRGERADGGACLQDVTDTKICRLGTTIAFIDENRELGNLLVRLEAQTTRCLNGICQKRVGPQDFWNDATTLAAMTAADVGARFGEYTGALPAADSLAPQNPILSQRNANQGAWYWVEVMPYDTSPGGLLAGRSKLDLNLSPGVVYRITAIARGQKPRTQVVLQSTFARQKLKN